MSNVRGDIGAAGASNQAETGSELRRQQNQAQLAKQAVINFSQSMQITNRTLEAKSEKEKTLFDIDRVNIIEDMVDAAGIVAVVHKEVADRILQRPEAEISTQKIEEEIEKRIANSIRKKRAEDLEAIAKKIKDDPAFITDHVYIQALVRVAIANVVTFRLLYETMLTRKRYIEKVCEFKPDRKTALEETNKHAEEAKQLLGEAETKLKLIESIFQKITAETLPPERAALGSDVRNRVREMVRIEEKFCAAAQAVTACTKQMPVSSLNLRENDKRTMSSFTNAVLLADAIIRPARIVRDQIEAIAVDARERFKAKKKAAESGEAAGAQVTAAVDHAKQQQQPAPITAQEADKTIRDLQQTMLADAKAAEAAAERAHQARKALQGPMMDATRQMANRADVLSMVQTKPYPVLCSLSEGVARTSRFILTDRRTADAMTNHADVAQERAMWAINTSRIDYLKPVPNETPASRVEAVQFVAERVKTDKQEAENAAEEAEKILQNIKQKVEANQQTIQEISEKLEKAETDRHAKIAAQLEQKQQPEPEPEPQPEPELPKPQPAPQEPKPKEGVPPKSKQSKPKQPKVKIEEIAKVHHKPPTHLQKYGKRYLSLLMGILIASLAFALLFTLSPLTLPAIIGITIGAGLAASLMTALGCTLFKGFTQKDKALKGDKKDANAPLEEGSTYQALKTLRIDPLATNNTETLNVWRAPQPTREYVNDNVAEPIQGRVNPYRPSMT